jgi:hypothetical protein
MSSDAIQLDKVEVIPISPLFSSMPGPTIDQADALVMSSEKSANNADAIEPVALQETCSVPKVFDEESHEARIERLGRQRPEQFKTLWAEIGFVFSIVMSQVMTVSFIFNGH